MKTYHLLPLLALFFCLHSLNVAAKPIIRNPSFEESTAVIWPGIVSGGSAGQPGVTIPFLLPGIPGWTNMGSCGLNPVITNIGQEDSDQLTPFSNNGITPHGTNVAFIQNGTIFQTVSGFEANRMYRVHFWCNGRANYAAPRLQVTLAGQVVYEDSVSAVEGILNHTVPYHEMVSSEFQAPGDGAFDLSFANLNISADSAILFDQISIEEFSLNSLVSASRDETIASKVTVVFSEKVKAMEASDPTRYSIEPGISVLSATLQADGLTVVLETTPIEDLAQSYTLRVTNFTDSEGRPMSASLSSIPVQLPAPPVPGLTISREESGMTIRWPKLNNQGYLLQATTTLPSENWAPLVATGEDDQTYYFIETELFIQRFYRLSR